jgi:hypothetical protein
MRRRTAASPSGRREAAGSPAGGIRRTGSTPPGLGRRRRGRARRLGKGEEVLVRMGRPEADSPRSRAASLARLLPLGRGDRVDGNHAEQGLLLRDAWRLRLPHGRRNQRRRLTTRLRRRGRRGAARLRLELHTQPSPAPQTTMLLRRVRSPAIATVHTPLPRPPNACGGETLHARVFAWAAHASSPDESLSL